MKRISGIPLVMLSSNNSSVVQTIIDAFIADAIANGFTYEAESCLRATLTNLVSIDLYPVGDAAMIALRNAAIADGSTFEAYNCGIILIQRLADINI